MVRSDGEIISRSSFTPDRRGIIPTAALWWDVGVEYAESRVGRLNLPALFQHRYWCRLIHRKKTVGEWPVQIRAVEGREPIVYSSDRRGRPLNGFVHRKENVYVAGRNFPEGAKVRIYVVRDRYAWETGDRLEPVRGEATVVRLDERQRNFTALVWPGKATEVGSYDVVVEYATDNRVFEQRDLTDSHRAVGFTVFAPLPSPGPSPPGHVETELACQAPPQDSSGNVIGAPNPVYKDVFAPVEEVWVAVNPNVGGGNYVGQSARLYVVGDKPQSGWADGTLLFDVSGGYETTVIQPGCANVNYTRVWASPIVGNYDVIVDFAPFGSYNVGQDMIDSLDKKGFVVPVDWICLESVSFDHNAGSSSSDGINIRINKSSDVVVPEWKKAKKTYPAAYVRNRTIKVKAVFSAGAGVNYCTIRAGVGSGSLGSVGQETVWFTSGSSGTVSFDVAGTTPNEIRQFYQKWDWEYEDINGSGTSQAHFASSKNKVYVVLADPLSPMAEPWVGGVLDRACWWASGESSEADAVAELTDGAYAHTGKTYYGGDSHAPSDTFYLTTFLQESWADCRDMSAYLHTLCRAVGISPVQMRRIQGSFDTKPILAIGNTSWAATSWYFHRVGHYGNVYDACLMLNQSAPVVPKNMDVNGNYKAGLYDSGSWSPGTPFDVTTIY
jgi:hypothetical protein